MRALVDSHCHLDSADFDIDREAVVVAAENAGLVAIINPGTNLETSQAAVALAEQYPMVFATVGVHPHHASTYTDTTTDALRKLAAHPRVVGIGEIGLDYYRNYSPQDAQLRAFSAQLELAATLGLPVIIHNRKASRDTFAALQAWTASNSHRGVFHSYSAGEELLEPALDLGFSVGISGPVTFLKSTALQQVARAVPLERLLIETDAPYLTPAPFRGQRNEPAYVRYVAERIADLRGLPLQQISQQTNRNAVDLFLADRTLT